MKFLDPKENILEVILTQYGRKKLAQGDLRIAYCSFGDGEVDYQVSTFSFSASGLFPPQLDLMVDWNPISAYIHLTGTDSNRIDILTNGTFGQSSIYSLSQSTETLAPLLISSIPLLNNKPAMHFTGGLASPYSVDVGSGSAFIQTPWTMYAIVFPDASISSSADTTSHLIDGFVAGHRNFMNYTQATQRWAVGNPTQALGTPNTFSSGTWQALCWQIDGAGNGVLFGMTASASPQTNFISTMISGAMGTHGFGGTRLGERFNNGLGWNGMIARVLIYTGSHSSEQRGQVASYFIQEYGLSIYTG